MASFLYNYQVVTNFATPVMDHALMLRCQPMRSLFQRIEEEHVVIPDIYRLSRGTDAYGNRILYGGTREQHSVLAYVSTGIVTQTEYVIPDASPAPYYGVPSRLTQPSLQMQQCKMVLSGTTEERAMQIAHEVNGMLEYTPGSTVLGTTAAEAFELKKGVCQDYAHLMIAFCRMNGIMARYVNGFVVGEGETHAWVEYYDGYAWRAIDPTYDTRVYPGYIKLAHGRDAFDCTVDRGTFMGVTQQQTSIKVMVKDL